MNTIMECEWTVWVGGLEVNEFLLPQDEATELALFYIQQGYDDVVIENTNQPMRMTFEQDWVIHYE